MTRAAGLRETPLTRCDTRDPLYLPAVAGRASIVGAAVSHVGNVRTHNEDSHFIDADEGLFVVCDGMGGHAAGEVASALAVNVIRDKWASNEVRNAAARWLQKGSPQSRKQLIDQIRGGVLAAHGAILEEASRDEAKTGMGTTLVGAVVVGGDCVFAHAGDSRAYLVRDGIAMQLTEDHTLLARLMAAGVEVDTTGEGSRFKSMLTNALGIGVECKVSSFVVPLADGDRFLLCSDGITEYVTEAEVGEILCKQPSPARAAQKLVDCALERGGADNATALVVRVLEAGERPQSASERKKDDAAIAQCALYAKLSPQQRLRAQRIALERDYPVGEKLPAQTLGDRVAWIVVEGEVELDGKTRGPGALIYPEALSPERALPDRDGLWKVTSDLRALALRSDDFREICADDEELAEVLVASLEGLLGPEPSPPTPAPLPLRQMVIGEASVDPRAATNPNIQLPVPVPRPSRPGCGKRHRRARHRQPGHVRRAQERDDRAAADPAHGDDGDDAGDRAPADRGEGAGDRGAAGRIEARRQRIGSRERADRRRAAAGRRRARADRARRRADARAAAPAQPRPRAARRSADGRSQAHAAADSGDPVAAARRAAAARRCDRGRRARARVHRGRSRRRLGVRAHRRAAADRAAARAR